MSHGDANALRWASGAPSAWDEKPLRALAARLPRSFTDGDWVESPHITDEGIRLIQTGNVGVGVFKEQGYRYISRASFEQLGCTEVLPGDLLICRLAGPVGRSCIAPDLGVPMITSVDVAILRPTENVDARYYNYAMSSSQYLAFMAAACRGGTRDRVSRSFLGSIRFPVPSPQEQTQIADFLDRETVQIDGMVDAQERLVALLEERRKAVVLDAVTRGVGRAGTEPDEPPSHWERLPIKALGRTQSGAGFPEAEQGLDDLPIPFYKVNALGRADADGVIRERYDTVDARTAERLRASVIPAGSVVLAKIGAALLLSRFRLLAYDSCIDNNMLAFIPNARVLGRYAMYAFEQLNLDQLVNPGAVPSLSDRVLRDFRLTWPGVGEQAEIVDYLDSATARINTMIAKARESVALMKERRAALISAAVTGGLDVRTGVDQVERELEEANA